MNIKEKVALELRVYRTRKGITQTELAEILGYSPPTILKMEKGDVDFKLSQLLNIRDKLGISIDDLLNEERNE